jgi:hypothetical protein
MDGMAIWELSGTLPIAKFVGHVTLFALFAKHSNQPFLDLCASKAKKGERVNFALGKIEGKGEIILWIFCKRMEGTFIRVFEKNGQNWILSRNRNGNGGNSSNHLKYPKSRKGKEGSKMEWPNQEGSHLNELLIGKMGNLGIVLRKCMENEGDGNGRNNLFGAKKIRQNGWKGKIAGGGGG